MFRWEETQEGHLERECIEETCTSEELSETLDNEDITPKFRAKYDKCTEIVAAVEQATPEFTQDYRKNLLRECILSPNDIEPPSDEMRVSLDDEDFKAWLGK